MDNLEPQLISCDEGGFTGPHLLDHDQPVFAYAAIDLTNEEAQTLIDRIRNKHRIQASELKSSLLRKRSNWPSIALEIAEKIRGRAIVIAFDKLLNLGGKTYEYLLEPVLQENNALFYRLNLHRFVMNGFYEAIRSSAGSPTQLAQELQAFMRSFDPKSAPTIFSAGGDNHAASAVLNCVVRFSRGYADKISERTQHLLLDEDGASKWTLDLTSTALFSLVFQGWGHRHPQMEIVCDESKPLRAVAPFFETWIGREEKIPATDGLRSVFLQGNLAKPLAFQSSATHPALQIADVVAGLTTDVIKNPGNPSYTSLSSWVSDHILQNYVLPNPALTDISEFGPRVNLTVLRELARRADNHEDPLAGMEEFCVRTMKRFRNPATRLLGQPKRRSTRR
jgi:hypothetical protein